MSDVLWLPDDQIGLIFRYLPRSRGVARVDDRRVLSGIFYVIKNGLQ